MERQYDKKKEGEEEAAALKELEELESVMESRELEEVEVWTMGECKKVLKSVGMRRCLDLKQRSRSKWAVDGDENSKYFHGLVNSRIASNIVPGLSINGNWLEKPGFIKREVFNFYRNRFKELRDSRPIIECENVKRLSDVDRDFLVQPFSLE